MDEGGDVEELLSGLQEPESRCGQVGGEGGLAVLAQVQVGSSGAVGLRAGERHAHERDLAAWELVDELPLGLAHVGLRRPDHLA